MIQTTNLHTSTSMHCRNEKLHQIEQAKLNAGRFQIVKWGKIRSTIRAIFTMHLRGSGGLLIGSSKGFK